MSLFTERNHYAGKHCYQDEPAERDMRNWPMFPPMRVWKDSLKYVFATLFGRIFPWCRVTKEDVQKVKRDLIAYLDAACEDPEERQRYRDKMKELWPEFAKMLYKNRGLVKFMNDGGSASLSFMIFPRCLVPGSPAGTTNGAVALESAFGANHDNSGRYRRLLEIDISRRSAAVEPIFVFIRERTHEVWDAIMKRFPLLKMYCTKVAEEKLGTVVFLAAGLLPEIRRFGMALAQIQSLKIVACDVDATLLDELDVVFQHDFGVPFSEAGIDYRLCEIDKLLADKTLYGKADMVVMDGLASYLDDEALLRYVTGAKKLLKPGGALYCDLQVVEASLIRCKFVQGWESDTDPETTVGKAKKRMQKIANATGMRLTEKVDSRNPRPLGVMFQLQKPENLQ